MIPFPHGVNATRLRRRMVTDPYSGEETLGSWADPDELTLEGVAFAPVSSEEAPGVDAETLSDMGQMLGWADIDVRAEDRIRDHLGDVWNVEGRPARYDHPMTGWAAGSVTRLSRWTEK